MSERIALNPARPGLNLVFGQIMDGMQKPRVPEYERCRQNVPENLNMGVHNVGLPGAKEPQQPRIHAVIEPRRFAETLDLYSRFIKQSLEIGSHSRPQRKDSRLVTIRMQALGNVNGNAFGAARSQHGNNLQDSNFFHGFSG